MIVIDGRQSDMLVGNFANLEEILVNVMGEDALENRVITDVLVNDEAFSEIYPHQAEDIGSEFIKSVEVRSIPVEEMAVSITQELHKVAQIMSNGSREVSRLFRQAEDTEALELLQDLLDVTRDFMSMLGVLRSQYAQAANEEFSANVEQFSSLLTEMSEVLENEDWILLADLLEYEFQPVCDAWQRVTQALCQDISNATQQ